MSSSPSKDKGRALRKSVSHSQGLGIPKFTPRIPIQYPRCQQRWYIFVGVLAMLAVTLADNTGRPSRLYERTMDPSDFLKRANRILETSPIIDGHNDLPYLIRIETKNKIYSERFTFESGLLSHTDLEKMREGKVGGQFWSVYAECPEDSKTQIDDPTWTIRDTLEQIDIAQRLAEKYPDDLQLCRTVACARRAFRSGKIASFMGMEGGHQLGNSLGVLRQMYDLGVRYVTITHNCDNAFGTAASTVAAGGEDKGLTQFGSEFVREMNRLGMLIDLSHASIKLMADVLAETKAPVIFSHSSAYALSQHVRNVPDDILRRVAKNGGIVMVTFVPMFLDVKNPSSVDIHKAADHIFHVAELSAWDHVGVGSDFDGMGDVPIGLENVSKFPQLVKVLLERGATEEQVRKFAGENILRVLSEVENYSKALESAGVNPNEETWSGRKWTRVDLPFPLMFNDSIGNRIPGKTYP
ncbi:hypothetical protein GX48_00913 [Paracoccidioides brasiliensis]|nr:hypothetical protein GX48_00913 [Paracoccidioides brasiliensis]